VELPPSRYGLFNLKERVRGIHTIASKTFGDEREENIPISPGNWNIFVQPLNSHYTDWAIPARNVLRPITFKVKKFRDGHFKKSELTFPGPLFGARATGVWRWTIKSIHLGLCGILYPFCTIAWCVRHVSNLPLNFRLFVWWILKTYYLHKIWHREVLLVRNPSPSSCFYDCIFLGKMFLYLFKA
jgi:hypothetical protein